MASDDGIEELRSTVRAFLSARSAEPEVRRLMETAQGHDPAVWAQMAQQLGLQSLAIPEEYGGSGFGLREASIVLEEAGRALLCAPLLGSAVLAPQAILASGDRPAAKEYLPGIAAGNTIAALAITGPGGSWRESDVAVRAHPDSDGWRLSGRAAYVLDGGVSDLLLVAARTADATALFLVKAPAAGVTRQPVTTLDLTRRQAVIDFDAAPARLIGAERHGWEAISRVLSVAVIALANEQVGGAQQVLEQVVEYARTRQQFGRAIGSFQAVKHSCAEMFLLVESARSAAYAARELLDTAGADLGTPARIAKVACSRAYTEVATRAIQVFGGMGFTWEHPAHLHLKRAKSSELLFGPPDDHLDALAATLDV